MQPNVDHHKSAHSEMAFLPIHTPWDRIALMGQDDELNQHHRTREPSGGTADDDQHHARKSAPNQVFKPKSPFRVSDEGLPDWSHKSESCVPEYKPTEVSSELHEEQHIVSSHKVDVGTSRVKETSCQELPALRQLDGMATPSGSGDCGDSDEDGENFQTPDKTSPVLTVTLADDTIAELLSTARNLAQEGKYQAAMGRYARLTRASAVLQDVIHDLESLRKRQSDPSPTLLQTLGDAYMKSNHLERALDLYRRASQYNKE